MQQIHRASRSVCVSDERERELQQRELHNLDR